MSSHQKPKPPSCWPPHNIWLQQVSLISLLLAVGLNVSPSLPVDVDKLWLPNCTVSLHHKPGKHFGELVHAPRLWSISTCFFLQEGTNVSNSEDCCQTGWDSPTPGWLMFIRGGWGWGWAGGGVRRSLSWLFPTSRLTSCSCMDSKGPRRLGKSVKSLSQASHFPICGTCCS